MFTALPPMVLGFMDQVISSRFSLAFPPVYKIGIRKELYGMKRFFIYMLDGIYQSIVCFFISYFAINEGSISPKGYGNNMVLMGSLAATIAVINANSMLLIEGVSVTCLFLIFLM
jgi:phospholipid-translocating ATPase